MTNITSELNQGLMSVLIQLEPQHPNQILLKRHDKAKQED